MSNVEDITDYIKSLRKGFDKDLLQTKIDELGYVVDTTGLDYEDFHTLFKLWLNLSIPITKWTILGCCLVPQQSIEGRTVEYAQRWLLANYHNQPSFSRIAFLLDWLTAAMDSEFIDMTTLDVGYEILYTMLTYEVLTAHCLKLLYVLTKPEDVTRWRVVELLDLAKKKENKKNICRQIQVLLGLFKSYKPECVPEDIPAVSIHTSFKKINSALLNRFRKRQEQKVESNEVQHLLWMNPLNSIVGRNKKANPLVPNLEFVSIGSKQYNDHSSQDNYLDYKEPAALVRRGARAARPARLRALLANSGGLALLALRPRLPAALLYDLSHLLTACFLESSPHSYIEKADFLHRLAELQRTLVQGISVVTRFLAQYLPLWNEKDYFNEILELVEWVSVESQEQIMYIVGPLIRIYHRAQPMEQCAILTSLTNMYVNLIYANTRRNGNYIGMKHPDSKYNEILPKIAQSISEMCNVALQINPDDMRVAWSSVRGAARMARAEARAGRPPAAPPALLPLALPLVSASAALIDNIAALVIQYKRLLKSDRNQGEQYSEYVKLLKMFVSDAIRCLMGDDIISSRDSSLIFNRLHPQLVEKLSTAVPNVDATFNLKNHIALLSYTCMEPEETCQADLDNKIWFDNVIIEEFTNLSDFLKKAVLTLR